MGSYRPKDTTRSQIRGRVTIVTAVFNAVDTLEACISSVLSQEYANLEYIIVDGGSNDGSIDVLQKFGNRIYWISEKDRGIYDAWNKAMAMASGEWIAFLGADDVYLPGAVSSYMAAVEGRPVEYISSRVRWIEATGRSVLIGEAWDWPKFQTQMCTAHVGSMHHYTFFQKYGQYDLGYKIVGDYELLLRAGPGLKTAFITTVTVEMQSGGASDSVAALAEARRAKISTGGRAPVFAAVEWWVARAKFSIRRYTLWLRSRIAR